LVEKGARIGCGIGAGGKIGGFVGV